MPTAEIITIGTEILLGEIVDTNTRYLSWKLREQGIDLFKQTTVGDNARRIAQAIQESISIADIIITTGGLGPTVDDPTREAVGLAVGVETEFRDELWEQIQERYQRFGRTPTENNKRQAYVPRGAIAVENSVGTAPAFILETKNCAIISLPGVPREMEHLMESTIIPYLRRRLDLGSVIKSKIIHTAGVGESQIDDLIGDLELLENPTVGLAAHSGQVDVRITAKADSEENAQAMIQEVEYKLRERLGDWIFGIDRESLEVASLNHLQVKGWNLAVVEAGLDGELIHRLASLEGPFESGQVLTSRLSAESLYNFVKNYRQLHQPDVVLGISILDQDVRQLINLVVISPEGEKQVSLPYGGPPENAITWAGNQSLDLIRKL